VLERGRVALGGDAEVVERLLAIAGAGAQAREVVVDAR
jgi:hypothetical protein